MRVLLVDDNPTAREIISSLLDSFGLQVEQATSGFSGTRAAQSAEWPTNRAGT